VRIAAFPKCWLERICDGRMPLESWIEASRELACEGLEFYSGFLASHDAGYLAGLRRSVEALGMTVPMMCCSPDFTVDDPAERSREVERERSMVRVTAALGGSFCRALSGQARPGLDVEEGVARVVSSIEACLPAAAECGVTLVMENHYKDGFWKHREFAQRKDLFVRIMTQAGTLLLLFVAAISLSFLACGLCLAIGSSPLGLYLALLWHYLAQYLPQRVVVYLLRQPP